MDAQLVGSHQLYRILTLFFYLPQHTNDDKSKTVSEKQIVLGFDGVIERSIEISCLPVCLHA